MMGMLCMQTSDTSIELYWKDDMLHSRKGKGTPPPQHIPVVEQFADRLSKKMKAEETPMWFEVINKTASAHFIGGMPIAERSAKGVVDPTSGYWVIQASTLWTAASCPPTRA
jgi:cholesterol oxidase